MFHFGVFSTILLLATVICCVLPVSYSFENFSRKRNSSSYACRSPSSIEYEAMRGRPAEHAATGWSTKEQYLPALEEED
jgi:hypothetical protein